MANRYVAGASGLPFAVLRGYAGTDLPEHTPTIATVTCPFTGEELTAVPAINPDVGDRARPARRPAGQRPAVGDRRGAEGGRAGVPAGAGHRRGDRGRARRRCPARWCCRTGWSTRSPRCPAARPVVRAGLLRPRQRPPTAPGTRSAATAPPFGRWLGDLAGGGGMTHPDEMMSVAASRALRDGQVCFVGIGLPSTAANLARRLHAPEPRADLRVRHPRQPPRAAAAVHRRRRAGHVRAHGDQRARGVQLLAAARPDRRRLPLRRPDRPLRQHQHHRDRRVRRAPRCGCPAPAARRRSRRPAAR